MKDNGDNIDKCPMSTFGPGVYIEIKSHYYHFLPKSSWKVSRSAYMPGQHSVNFTWPFSEIWSS